MHGRNRGHAYDQGLRGFLHYMLLVPMMWRSRLSTEVVRLIAPKAGERVVDLGAGMGAATIEAVHEGASVVAVDPAPYMRSILRLRSWWPGRKAITVLKGAAESIPLADASIDALWTVNTLHHWTERSVAARELARVVRLGGRMLLVDEDMDDSRHRAAHPFAAVDVGALAQALRSAGFASAEGTKTTLAGVPVCVVRAVR
jgi:SAM-dependent methyltransferase